VPTSLTISPDSLAAAFAAVPDPRRHASITYPLATILTLAVAAIVANHTSVLAIAEWGRRQPADWLARLGCPAGRAPCQSTLQRLFAKLDGHALASVVATHFAASSPPGATLAGIAIDGKAFRGRLQYDAGGCPVHALTAFCHAQGVVLAHEPIEHGTEKTEAELTVAPALIDQIDWRQRVLTGDALFCQRQLCQQVVDAGGDYLLLVKENQPTLFAAIQVLFDPPPADALALLDRREVHTSERGHGRRDDTRQLVASTDLNAYLDWPGLRQVFRLEHTWRERGRSKQHRHYGITSLTPARGTPAQLLALKRGHWLIENRLHRGKDVVLGEDASLIHVGQGPTVMALLREAALSLLYRTGNRRIRAQLREYSQRPEVALALVLASPPARA
jgi:predicted transposase YbfD/YdcC